MKSSIHMSLLLILILLACAPAAEKKDTLQITLKPLPESVSEELEEAGAYLEKAPVQAPDVCEPGEWPLLKTGERVLALLDKGGRERVLSARDKELLINMADYMLAFHFEDEEDFCLPGAALALAGLALSTPKKPDLRYGYGLSRMWFGYIEWDRPERMRDIISYVLDAAVSRGLPLLPEMLEFYADTEGKAPANVKTFDLGGTELEFLQELELPDDWGLKLSAALKVGNKGLAKSVAAHYYADKISCLRPLVPAGGVDLDEARDILKNIIILRAHMERRHDFGETVDWTTVLDGDIESNVSLNHHPMMLHLAKAWDETGDGRFRDHLIKLMRSWLDQSPRPNIGRGLQWRTLEVGGRAANRWPHVLALLSGDSTFVAEMFFPVVYSLYQHADYLMVNNMRHPNNWSQVESAGLLAASLLLSEHKDSGLYRRTALRRFRYLNSILYFPDGLQTENSFYYHGFPLGTQMNVYELARSLGTVLDTSWTGMLERGIEVFVLSAQPDGSVPMVSDVGPRKLFISEWQKCGREAFPENPLFKYPVGAKELSAAGPPPRVKSYLFRYPGYGIMREDWTPDAQYMLFEMGFYGINHQHEDKLNIILCAYGRELLHDPGIYRYSDDGFERYFRGSRGHNLVLVDDKGQRRDLFFDKYDPYKGLTFPDQDSRWLDRKKHVLAQGVYRQGFADKLLPLWGGNRALREKELASLVKVEHSRKVLWVKGEYWVVADCLEGDGSHKVEQVWHFSPLIKAMSKEGINPGVVKLRGNKAALSANPGVANLSVLQVGGDDLLLRKEKGEKDPHVGWTSLYGEIPAWDVTFEVRRELPTALVTVLYPMKPGIKKVPGVRVLRQDTEAAVFDLVFGDHTDRIVFALSRVGAEVALPDEGSFDGEVLILRKDAGGGFKPLLHEGGRSLVMEGKQVPLAQNE